MVNDNQSQSGGTDERLKGWDTDAFWFPTLDRRGALLGVFVVLIALHFDSMWGFAGSRQLVAGWLPVTFAYHVALGVLYVAFMVLIYVNWPEHSEEAVQTEQSQPRGAGTASATED